MFDHNYLRITRILKCLMTFGLIDEAQAFYECLRQIYREESDQIGGETFQYWTNQSKLTQQHNNMGCQVANAGEAVAVICCHQHANHPPSNELLLKTIARHLILGLQSLCQNSLKTLS